jgi:hypothetical protein
MFNYFSYLIVKVGVNYNSLNDIVEYAIYTLNFGEHQTFHSRTPLIITFIWNDPNILQLNGF